MRAMQGFQLSAPALPREFFPPLYVYRFRLFSSCAWRWELAVMKDKYRIQNRSLFTKRGADFDKENSRK